MTPSAPAPTEEIVTSTPSTTPVSDGEAAGLAFGEHADAPRIARQQAPAEDQRQRGGEQRHAQHLGHQRAVGRAGRSSSSHSSQQRQQRSRAGCPVASRRTMRQSMVRLKPCTSEPPVLVTLA